MLARGRNSCGAGGGDVVPFGIFPRIIKAWSGLELSLTYRQGDFAEDLSEEGKRTKTSGTSWQTDAAIRSLYTKKQPACKPPACKFMGWRRGSKASFQAGFAGTDSWSSLF